MLTLLILAQGNFRENSINTNLDTNFLIEDFKQKNGNFRCLSTTFLSTKIQIFDVTKLYILQLTLFLVEEVIFTHFLVFP